jgi:hypothetical protein
MRKLLGILAEVRWRGILKGGPARTLYFARTLSRSTLRQLPLLFSDWIAALSMKEFAERQFAHGPDHSATAAHLQTAPVSARTQQGRVRIQMEGKHLASAAGLVDQAFFAKASRAIKRLMKNTSSTVTLHVEHFQEEQRQHWQRLLWRLRRSGDRIYVSANETLKEVLDVDSSVFHLVLEPAA